MGIWNGFVELLFEILLQIYYVVGDWGLAIILLTVFVRLLMTPLMIKQVRSMHEIQKIQPLIKELQAKYKDDREKLQQKTMELYSEHKVNPFASCLPMILQMPIFIALYQMLAGPVGGNAGGPLHRYLESTGGVGGLFGIIENVMLSSSTVFADQGLLAAIPYIVLLLFFASSMMIPQLMMPNGGDKSQRMMMMVMVPFMLFIGWGVPAGVLLYWDVGSIIAIAQQWFTQRLMKKSTNGTAGEIVVDKPKKVSKKQQKHDAAREEATHADTNVGKAKGDSDE